MDDSESMLRAIELAKQAALLDEVPVGAVVTHNGRIVGEGFNRRETGKNALAHAEIEAINMACNTLGGWRLAECEMFVTLEPCPMCAGAIINARIPRVVPTTISQALWAVLSTSVTCLTTASRVSKAALCRMNVPLYLPSFLQLCVCVRRRKNEKEKRS